MLFHQILLSVEQCENDDPFSPLARIKSQYITSLETISNLQ